MNPDPSIADKVAGFVDAIEKFVGGASPTGYLVVGTCGALGAIVWPGSKLVGFAVGATAVLLGAYLYSYRETHDTSTGGYAP